MSGLILTQSDAVLTAIFLDQGASTCGQNSLVLCPGGYSLATTSMSGARGTMRANNRVSESSLTSCYADTSPCKRYVALCFVFLPDRFCFLFSPGRGAEFGTYGTKCRQTHTQAESQVRSPWSTPANVFFAVAAIRCDRGHAHSRMTGARSAVTGTVCRVIRVCTCRSPTDTWLDTQNAHPGRIRGWSGLWLLGLSVGLDGRRSKLPQSLPVRLKN